MHKKLIRLCLHALFFLAILIGEAFAGSQKVNLVPEEGFFGVRARISSYYYAAVSEKLLTSKPFVLRSQAVFLPSFSPESAVYIIWDDEKSNTVPVVVSVEMERSLHSELQQLIRDAAPDKNAIKFDPAAQLKVLPKLQLKTNRREAPIERSTARILDRLWSLIISKAKFPENAEFGLDGEDVYFASPSKGGYHTARTWSPNEGTPAYELVTIARELQKYPQLREDKRKGASESLTKMAKRLLAKIENSK